MAKKTSPAKSKRPPKTKPTASFKINPQRFEEIPAKRIDGCPDNFRVHTTEQQRKLTAVLDEVGFVGAVLVRPKGKRFELIDGHERLTRFGPDDPVPCLVVDVDVETARKALASYDAIGALAVIDEDKLKALRQKVTIRTEGLADLVDDVLAKAKKFRWQETPPDDGRRDGEDGRKLAKKWKTAPAKLWAITSADGRREHRLICGDSTDADLVGRLLDGVDPPQLMVTDPPYGVSYDAAWREGIVQSRGQQRSKAPLANDQTADWSEAYRLFTGPVAYVWHATWFGGQIAAQLAAQGFEHRATLIWKKQQPQISRGHYHWQHEPCLYLARGTAGWTGGRDQSTVWEFPNLQFRNKATEHRSEKPLDCFLRPLENHRKLRGLYDPFAGSGTALVACEQAGRTGYAAELDPHHCATILERLQVVGCTVRVIS